MDYFNHARRFPLYRTALSAPLAVCLEYREAIGKAGRYLLRQKRLPLLIRNLQSTRAQPEVQPLDSALATA